jgi:hypothetical protein
MLVEFVNTRPDPEAFERFRRRWEIPPAEGKEGHKGFRWEGGHDYFEDSQALVRAIWAGKKRGTEGLNVALRLGVASFERSEEGGEVVAQEPSIEVDWEEGSLVPAPRSLNDVVWFTLLAHSRRLAICANKDNGCPTPYFLKNKPKHRFCSDACALPAQREFKRKWWTEHGKEWRRRRSKRKTGKRR